MDIGLFDIGIYASLVILVYFDIKIFGILENIYDKLRNRK